MKSGEKLIGTVGSKSRKDKNIYKKIKKKEGFNPHDVEDLKCDIQEV